MPKGGDSLCPLGFHPQFRRPNYCKRCFREYGEHKSRDLSGSTTSLNSLANYDASTNTFSRRQDDGNGKDSVYGSRDSLVSSSRIKEEIEGTQKKPGGFLSRSKSEDEDEKKSSSPWAAKSNSWSRSRPMSWSAQDLRAAVDEAKTQVHTSREDVSNVYGSSRSLSQDLGSLSDLREGSTDPTLGDSRDSLGSGPSTSFSSYLSMSNMRTKSPGRPPLGRASSSPLPTIPANTSLSPPKSEEEKRVSSKPLRSSSSLSSSVTSNNITSNNNSSSSSSTSATSPSSTTKIRSILKEESGEEKSSKRYSQLSPKLNSIQKSSTLGSTSEGRPPKPPVRIKEKERPFTGSRLSDVTEERPRRIIQALKDDDYNKTYEVESDGADASYVIQLSKPKKDPTVIKRVEIDLQPELARVQKENKELDKQLISMQELIEQLEADNKELLIKKPTKFGDLKKQTDATKLQQKVDDMQDEIKKKNKEVKELGKEIEKRPLPKDIEKAMEDLRSKLSAAEQLCEDLMDENEDYKKDVQALEDEVEELQDNFREEQADEYRNLKRELEQRAKDCRVLQFKLKKSDRRSESLERDKMESEEKLRELQIGDADITRADRIKSLEKDLGLAKEVSMKMHEEMEHVKKQLETAESERKKLKENLADKPKYGTNRYSRSNMMGRDASQDNSEQLQRDLQATQEREQDIKEQLKFAEEETKSMRKKLSRVEEENETLQLQLNKMSTKAKANRQRSLERSGSLERASSVERGTLSRQGSSEKPPQETIQEELDPTDLKIQLELNEQESGILRRKVEDLESENDRLQKEIKGFISSHDSKKSDKGSTQDSTKDNVYLDRKIKMLERESSDLQKKIHETEKDRDQFKIDLDLAKKRAKTTRSRSLEKADSEIKLKLEKAEKDIEQLKSRLEQQTIENDTLLDENKKMSLKNQRRIPPTSQESLFIEKSLLEDKLKRSEKKVKDINDKLNKLESNNSDNVSSSVVIEKNNIISELQDQITEVQEKCAKYVKDIEEIKNYANIDRTPKKPKDTTPKTTLVKWVTELDSECAQLHLALKDTENKIGGNGSTVATSSVGSRPPSEDLTSLRDLEDKLERERERNDELTRQLHEERQKLNEKSATSSTINDDTNLKLERELKDLKRQLRDEQNKFDELSSQNTMSGQTHFEELRASQTEKHRIQKELASSHQKIHFIEKKLKEAEETIKISERTERNLRSAVDLSESKLEEERTSLTQCEDRHREMTMAWLKERDEMKKELTDIKKTRDKAEKDLKSLQKIHDSMELRINAETRKKEEAIENKKREAEHLKTLKVSNEHLLIDMDDLKDTIRLLEREKEKNTTKHKREMDQLIKERDELNMRMTTLETEIKSEKKKRERLEKETGGATKDRLGNWNKSSIDSKDSIEMESLKKEHKLKSDELASNLKREKQSLDDLQKKFDLLEEDYVVLKAQISTKTDCNREYTALKRDYDTIEAELKTLRETYNLRQDTWIKEKLAMQEQLKGLEDRLNKATAESTLYGEKRQLKDIIEDKTHQIDTLIKEEDALRDQVIYHRRESEELRRKTEDLEKLQELSDKRQSSIGNDTSGFESTIKDLRTRMNQTEKTNKTENTKLKMKYDTMRKAMGEEVTSLTSHMSKYRRERDTYKDMLDQAQKNIAELKGSTTTTYRTSRADTATEAQAHLSQVQELHSSITELEDKVADAKLENARMKNNLVDQKSSSDIQVCDLQSRINEYEEDRLLGGGSRRVPGLRTRLELNWQKEREEQQRLIQDTATLAKDLRQTLYEVERERDMEKLEAKRKVDQLRRTVTQEHQDTKNRVQELQRDLIELREAHAKLRQINEKLRREKDRTEVEREAMRDKFLGTSRDSLNQTAKFERMVDEMKKLKDLSPLVLGDTLDGKDSSLTNLPGDPKPRTKEEFTEALKKMGRTMEELKVMLHLTDDRDRLKRAQSFRRALSVESDDDGPPLRSRSATRGMHRGPMPRANKGLLYRKAQSLDHQMAEERGKIWVSTDAGSTSSIDSSMTDDMRRSKYDRDVSLDRISTGSQTSTDEVLVERKKSGLKSVFSKFGKSKSIEESPTGGSIIGAGVKAMAPGVGGSGGDIPGEVEKDSMKGKLKTFFKKSAPPSNRTRSMDREGPSVRKTANTFESDTISIASKSVTRSPRPVIRR